MTKTQKELNLDAEKYVLTAILKSQARLAIFMNVRPIVEAWGLKEVNKRLATQIEKSLKAVNPEYRVFYDPDRYGWRTIGIYGGALAYDDRVTIDFTRPEEYLKTKTWAESVQDKIDALKMWTANAVSDIERLTQERDNLRYMITDWQRIVDQDKAARAAFVKKYGSAGHFSETELTYTVREALNIATGEKPQM